MLKLRQINHPHFYPATTFNLYKIYIFIMQFSFGFPPLPTMNYIYMKLREMFNCIIKPIPFHFSQTFLSV